jgi:hypothetical protein
MAGTRNPLSQLLRLSRWLRPKFQVLNRSGQDTAGFIGSLDVTSIPFPESPKSIGKCDLGSRASSMDRLPSIFTLETPVKLSSCSQMRWSILTLVSEVLLQTALLLNASRRFTILADKSTDLVQSRLRTPPAQTSQPQHTGPILLASPESLRSDPLCRAPPPPSTLLPFYHSA